MMPEASAVSDESSFSERSIDELDAAICSLTGQLNARTYQWLVLVREFDDRRGWAKWGCRSCAGWLALRCQLSLPAARGKARSAQALRGVPSISAAVAGGPAGYPKTRCVT